MKTRSTFRRRQNGPNNAVFYGYRAAYEAGNSQAEVNDGFRAAREIGRNAKPNLPGETNRQFAARMRAEAATTEAPARPKRVRAKKAAA